MASGNRTLKLSILADVDSLKKGLTEADAKVEGFGGKLEKFGKMAAAAFAAAAAAAVAYAGKLAVDGVKAALDDEKAQRILALTLENVTNATKDQIAAVESYISKTALATGVTDDKLRPAFSRLARSTKDIKEAQDLLNLSLDISSATQKPLEAVATALGKAYDGNTNALGRLGLGIDQNIIKSKDFNKVAGELRNTFGGFASQEAATLQGQIERLKVTFDEAKEAVGFALLPIIKTFIDYITERFIPLLIQAKDKALTPIKEAFENNKEAIKDLWQFTKDYLVPLFEFTVVKAIERVGQAIGVLINIIGTVMDGIKGLVRGAVSAINSIIPGLNKIPGVNIPLIQLPDFATTSGGVSMQRVQALASQGFDVSGLQNVGGSFANATGGIDEKALKLGGFGSVKELTDRLLQIQDEIGSLTFKYQTGQITKTQTQAALDKLKKEMNSIERLAGNLSTVFPGPSTVKGGFARGEYGPVTINVNAPSVMDETGFTRAVIDAMNSLERRQAGGLSALVSL